MHFAASVPRARHPPTIPKRMDRDGSFRPFRLGWQRESVPFGMDGGFHPRIHPLALGWRMLSIPASIPTPSIPARRDGIRIPAPARSPWDGEGRNAPMPASGAVSPKSDAARTFSCRGLRCEGIGHPCQHFGGSGEPVPASVPGRQAHGQASCGNEWRWIL